MSQRKTPGSSPGVSRRFVGEKALLAGLFLFFLAALLQGRAQDVAERGAGVGGAVLRDRFLLLGDFQRLDRDRDLVGLTVERSDAGVHLLADGETLGTLLAAITGQIGALDEGNELGADDLDVDAGL